MKRTGRRVASFALILIAGTLLGLWYWHWQSITPRVRVDFEWFSTLGFPDVKGCPYVFVTTGRGTQEYDEQQQRSYFNGFLLATNGNSFTVLAPDLLVQTFTNSASDVSEPLRTGYKVVNLNEEVKLIIRTFEQPPSYQISAYSGGRLTPRAELFALAWACWRQGQEINARSLYEEAKRPPMVPQGKDEKETIREKAERIWRRVLGRFKNRQPKRTLRQNLENDFGVAMTWVTLENFKDFSLSRSQLLSQVETILKNYPHSDYRQSVSQIAEALRQTIAEDQQHKMVRPEEFAGLGTEEKVSELIFQLRDQDGEQWSMDSSDIFQNFKNRPDSTNGPACQLVALGYSAMPQLIATLESKTLTRSVFAGRGFNYNRILSVGDCALAILRQITGRDFTKTGSKPWKWNDRMSFARQAAESWWREFQKKGEKQMLIEGVRAAESDAPDQAFLLRQRHPDVASATIVSGIQAAGDSWVRERLIQNLGELDDLASREFLKMEMLNRQFKACRIAAARGLSRFALEEAVGAMIREWENLPEKSDVHDNEAGALVEFLASCNSVEAISALESKLVLRPVDLRMRIIKSLDEVDEASPATFAAIEKCFAVALEDTEEQLDTEEEYNGVSCWDPRVCDVAAHFLARRWPERYTFDLVANYKTRERQRIECLNMWRRAHSLAVMPLPEQSLTKVRGSESTRVTAIEWMDGSVKPEPTFAARIEKLKDKRLAGEELVELFTGFARKPETGAAGLEIKCFKDEDLTGVRMLVKLIPGAAATESEGWESYERVKFGNEILRGGFDFGKLEEYVKLEDWEELVEAVKVATAGAPRTPFEINVRVRADREN